MRRRSSAQTVEPADVVAEHFGAGSVAQPRHETSDGVDVGRRMIGVRVVAGPDEAVGTDVIDDERQHRLVRITGDEALLTEDLARPTIARVRRLDLIAAVEGR